jgi:hypothetical protein
MWRAACLAVAVATSGCAVHTASVHIISTRWSTVEALAPGTEIAIAMDDDEIRSGRIVDVAPGALRLRERRGVAQIPRASVARLAVRVANGTSRLPGFLKTAIGAAAVSALAGAFIAAVGENGLTIDDGWSVFAIGTIAGTAYAAARPPARKYEDRVIYIRP